MSEFSDALRQAQEMMDEGKQYAADVEDGQYRMQLIKAQMAFAKTSGALMIKRTHQILDGEHDGKHVFDNLNLNHPVGWSITLRWVEMCGYEEPADATALEDIVAGLNKENPVVVARVEKDGNFTNVNVIEIEEESAVVEATPEVERTVKESKTTKTTKAKKIKAGTGELAVGNAVTFSDDDANVVGKIVDFEDEDAHVEDSAGEVWIVAVSDLTVIESKTEQKKAGGKKKKAGGKKKKAGGKRKTADDRALLLAFAQANEVDKDENIDDTTEVATLVETLNEYEWPKKELTDQEVELLNRTGVEYK